MTSIDIEAVRALLARVETASGPSFDLDRAIGLVIGGWKRIDLGSGHAMLCNSDGGSFPDDPGSISGESFTSSLDAAVALVERVLPGWWWNLSAYEPGKYEAFINPPEFQDPDEHPCGMGMEASPAKSLVRALLHALIARAEAGEQT